MIKKKYIINRDVVFCEQEFFTNIRTSENPSDIGFVPRAISVSYSIESDTNKGKLHEEFGIDNEPVIGNDDDMHTEGVEQGGVAPTTSNYIISFQKVYQIASSIH